MKQNQQTDFSEVLFLEHAQEIRNLETEQVIVLFLDSKLEVLAKTVISQQSIFQTEFCARTIFAPALIHAAANVVLLHNHPSGLVKPSSADYVTTMMLSHVGTILQVPLIDHLIVTKENYFSFRKEGIL